MPIAETVPRPLGCALILRLSPEMLAALDALADRRGVERSQLIREAIAAMLAADAS